MASLKVCEQTHSAAHQKKTNFAQHQFPEEAAIQTESPCVASRYRRSRYHRARARSLCVLYLSTCAHVGSMVSFPAFPPLESVDPSSNPTSDHSLGLGLPSLPDCTGFALWYFPPTFKTVLSLLFHIRPSIGANCTNK